MSAAAGASKEYAPPSYEEAVYAATSPSPPQVGVVFPNVSNINVGIHQASATAPPLHSQQGFVPTYGAFETTPVSVVVQPPTVTMPPEIIVIGGCPACRIGYLEDAYPCLGLLCAIVFFPVGILCCLAMKTKRCSNCGSEF